MQQTHKLAGFLLTLLSADRVSFIFSQGKSTNESVAIGAKHLLE